MDKKEMTIVGVNVSEDTARRFRENRHGQPWEQYINRLMDAADSQMSEFEKDTLRILQEKQKRIESRKR